MSPWLHAWLRTGEPHPRALLETVPFFGLPAHQLLPPPGRFFDDDVHPHVVELNVEERDVTQIPAPLEVLAQVLPADSSWQGMSRAALAALEAWFLICEDPEARLQASPVESLLHQRSLVQHILSNPDLRMVLIGDEVGLGKTIEAGLLIKEILNQRPAARILYLAPARLVRNVDREFRRLGLDFDCWISGEGNTARNDLTDARVIASIHRAVLDRNYDRWVKSPPWDAIIADECHHLSAYGPDGEDYTFQYALVRDIAAKQPADGRLILMSGTPHQGNPERFRNLLRLLGVDSSTPVAPIIYRTKDDVRGWYGEPLFPARDVHPPAVIPIPDEYRAWLDAIHSFYGTSGRGTEASARASAWRRAQALQWAASSVQAGLGYLIRQAVRAGEGEASAAFGRALRAIRPYRGGPADEDPARLLMRLQREVASQRAGSGPDDAEDTGSGSDTIDRRELERLLDAGVALLQQTGESKWDFIHDRILAAAPDDQFVLFAQPIETVTALAAYLERRSGRKPAIIIGEQTEEERDREIAKFWRGEARFLVSSRAGAEGINLHCAHHLVHVDVPWNPMDLEQRVGRVHRYGSRETIVIDTVVLDGSREQAAYAAAHDKLRQIAGALAADPARREALFSRVMSLVAPEELRAIIASRSHGPLGTDDQDRLARLIENSFRNYTEFRDRYHSRHVPAPEPGSAMWSDLETFATRHGGAKAVVGIRALRFEIGADGRPHSKLDEVPVLEFLNGDRLVCADVSGRPLSQEGVQPAGLNQPVIARALREAALNGEPGGAAHLRWPIKSRPEFLPGGVFGILVFARQTVQARHEGFLAMRSTLLTWVIPSDGEPQELSREQSATLIRGLRQAGVRRDPEISPALFDRMAEAAESFGATHRQPTPEERQERIFHALRPVFAATIAPES